MCKVLDHILRGGIKLCMITGVALTMAACYGPVPPPEVRDNPEYQKDQQQTEQQIQALADSKIG